MEGRSHNRRLTTAADRGIIVSQSKEEQQMARDYKDTMAVNLEKPIYPTTYGTEIFHPAIMLNGRVHYWPNITFATEQEAYSRACETFAYLKQEVEDIVSLWNIYPA